MPILEMFAKLGLPSALVAMVLIAVIFRKTNSQVSKLAAFIAIFLVAAYGLIQLVEALRGSDIKIEVKPEDSRSFNSSGSPVDLEILVAREGKIINKKRIDKLSGTAYQDYLRNAGLRRAEECRTLDTANLKLWNTDRVYVGRAYRLGETSYGLLKIRAMRFTGAGDAIVTLELAGREEPMPKEVPIKNKGLGEQSFPEVPVFHIAVREADFRVDPPWAAFTVFSSQ